LIEKVANHRLDNRTLAVIPGDRLHGVDRAPNLPSCLHQYRRERGPM
jgi:hypothetical protein